MLALRPSPICHNHPGTRCSASSRSRLLQGSKHAAVPPKQEFASERCYQSAARSTRRCSRRCWLSASLSCTRIHSLPLSRKPLNLPNQAFQQQQLFTDVSNRCFPSRKRAAYHAVSAVSSGDASLDQPGLGGSNRATNMFQEALRAVQQELDKLNGQWDKFLPMILVRQSLFFVACSSYVALLILSLKRY